MFSTYMKKLSAVKKLTPEEEKKLWRAYKDQGDAAARRRIIEAYQPLVFREVYPYRSLSAAMDAVQEGTIGLIEAVERYDRIMGQPSASMPCIVYAGVSMTFCGVRDRSICPAWRQRRRLMRQRKRGWSMNVRRSQRLPNVMLLLGCSGMRWSACLHASAWCSKG
mgnify:CR=1 FL=1